MKAQIVAWLTGVMLFAAAACGGEILEKVHVVKWPKRPHGYRGAMGDFVQLKDGSILMSYTQDGVGQWRFTERHGGRSLQRF